MSEGTGADERVGGGGVLGNLPRSRPGYRSDKRGEPESGGAEERGDAQPRARDRAPASGGGRGMASARPVTPAPEAGSEGGPLGGAARAANRAARLGLDVAGGVLKRLPRP
jgi:hypothetical protein